MVKIDPEQGKVTVRATDGMTHVFQASKETLQGYKLGDRIGGEAHVGTGLHMSRSEDLWP